MCAICQDNYAVEHEVLVGPLCPRCRRFRLAGNRLENGVVEYDVCCYHCVALDGGLEECVTCAAELN
jgi:hypothetical protein